MNKWYLKTAFALLLAVLAGCGGETADPKGSEDDKGKEKAAGEEKNNSLSVVVDPEQTAYLTDVGDPNEKPIFREARTVSLKYENGKLKREHQVHFYENRPSIYHGSFTEWHENGQKWKEGQYKEGKRVGEWKYWDVSGALVKSGNYKDGKLDSTWTYNRVDGTRDRVENYVDGNKQGEWSTYDVTGQHTLEVQVYRNNILEGTSARWFPPKAGATGPLQKQIEINFVGGRQHGELTEWYESGKKKHFIEFRNGKRHGTSKQWSEDGELLAQVEFRDGERVQEN